jgi:hypothetical protein
MRSPIPWLVLVSCATSAPIVAPRDALLAAQTHGPQATAELGRALYWSFGAGKAKAQLGTGIEARFAVAGELATTTALFVTPCPPAGRETVEKAGYVGAPWFWSRRVFFPKDRRSISFTEPAP